MDGDEGVSPLRREGELAEVSKRLGELGRAPTEAPVEPAHGELAVLHGGDDGRRVVDEPGLRRGVGGGDDLRGRVARQIFDDERRRGGFGAPARGEDDVSPVRGYRSAEQAAHVTVDDLAEA